MRKDFIDIASQCLPFLDSLDICEARLEICGAGKEDNDILVIFRFAKSEETWHVEYQRVPLGKKFASEHFKKLGVFSLCRHYDFSPASPRSEA